MAKKKSMTHPFRKFIPLIVFAAILGAAVFVAAQLSTRQGIAPNAPDSEPAAYSTKKPCNKCNIYGRCSKSGIKNCVIADSECGMPGKTCKTHKYNLGCGQDCLSAGQCAGGLSCATSSANPRIGKCINRGQKCISPKVPGPNGCSCITPPTPTVLRLDDTNP